MYDTNDTNNQNDVYQTSSSTPEMRLHDQVNIGKEKKGDGAGRYFKKLLASVTFGLCFGLFAGLGFYAVEQSTGIFSSIAGVERNGESVKDMIKDVLSSYENEDQEFLEESPSGVPLVQNVSMITSDVSDVVEAVMPAMVSIVNSYVESYNYFGQQLEKPGNSSGSGIIVGENDTELLIATNYHVIEGAKGLTVNFIDGTTGEAVVKGSDPEMDLAVIAISLESLSEETKNAISIAKLGDSDSLKLGTPVIAIGNALGYGQSVSGGWVSALNREVEMSDGSKGTFIQTDAAINPGNSGGALLNISGEVIGINSSKIGGSTVEGMGFAIPISAAQPILEDLMARQTRNLVAEGKGGFIGISLQQVTEEDSERYGMPVGIYVYGVIEGGAAHQAGILRGDIITKFDGNKIRSAKDLTDLLKYYSAGETVEISVMRPKDGEYKEEMITLTLGEKQESSQ